jgi:hypothetical protein
MNRFGLFIPGVSRSGDATGFNPQNAAETLTVTWKGEAEAARFRTEAAEAASLPQRWALAEHVWRHAVALERAIDQWRGDVFYALGGAGRPDPFLR